MNINGMRVQASAPGGRLVASLQTAKQRCPSDRERGGCLNLNFRNKGPIISVTGSDKAARLLSATLWLRHIFESPI